MPSLPTFSFEPLPFHVPTEIKRHILKFCDRSTLAKTARVSLAFLELSFPLLYRNVLGQISGLYRLQRFFCERVSSLFVLKSFRVVFLSLIVRLSHQINPQPTVTPFLSLSQIDTFHFTVLPDDRYFLYMDDTSRIPSLGCLPIRHLTITDDEERWERKDGYLNLLSLLELFQPVEVELRTVPYQNRSSPSKLEYACISGLRLGRLRRLEFVNMVPSGPLRPSEEEMWDEEEMGLNFPLLPLTVILCCTSSVKSRVSSWLDAIEFHLKEWKTDWEGVVKLEVRVGSKEMVELAKEKLVTARDWSKTTFKIPQV